MGVVRLRDYVTATRAGLLQILLNRLVSMLQAQVEREEEVNEEVIIIIIRND
jgi:hypothetical protein